MNQFRSNRQISKCHQPQIELQAKSMCSDDDDDDDDDDDVGCMLNVFNLIL
jgi:hypothetical protein